MDLKALAAEATARRVDISNLTDRHDIIQVLQASRFYTAANMGAKPPKPPPSTARSESPIEGMSTSRIKMELAKLGVPIKGLQSRDEFATALEENRALLAELDGAPGYDPITSGDAGVRKLKRDLDTSAASASGHEQLVLSLVSHPPREDRPAQIALPRGRVVRVRRKSQLPSHFADDSSTIDNAWINAEGLSLHRDLISRVHAELRWRPDGRGGYAVFLADGHSGSQRGASNGSSVDEVLVAPCGIVPLRVGSLVEFGSPHLMVSALEAPPPRRAERAGHRGEGVSV